MSTIPFDEQNIDQTDRTHPNTTTLQVLKGDSWKKFNSSSSINIEMILYFTGKKMGHWDDGEDDAFRVGITHGNNGNNENNRNNVYVDLDDGTTRGTPVDGQDRLGRNYRYLE